MEAPKRALREVALSRRALLDDRERAAAGEALRTGLSDVLSHARRVAGYVAVGTEPPTASALMMCSELLLPVLLPDGDLDWAAGPDVAPASRGLVEPTGRRLGP